jgi:hypothetical protein
LEDDGVKLYDRLAVLSETYQMALERPEEEFDEERFRAFAESVYRVLNTPEVMFASLAILSSADPEGIHEIACATDALAFWITSMREVAKSYLRLMKKRKLIMKGRLWTDLDRGVELESACNRAITLVALLDSQYEHLTRRLTLCENLSNNIERERWQGRMSPAT